MSAARRRALVLAAGYGTRLRPLTEELPKPLLPVLGRTLLARTLDALAAVGAAARRRRTAMRSREAVVSATALRGVLRAGVETFHHLKKLLAEAELDKAMLKELAEGNF